MLHRSAATVTLHIEALRVDQLRQLERLLKRLAPMAIASQSGSMSAYGRWCRSTPRYFICC